MHYIWLYFFCCIDRCDIAIYYKFKKKMKKIELFIYSLNDKHVF